MTTPTMSTKYRTDPTYAWMIDWVAEQVTQDPDPASKADVFRALYRDEVWADVQARIEADWSWIGLSSDHLGTVTGKDER